MLSSFFSSISRIPPLLCTWYLPIDEARKPEKRRSKPKPEWSEDSAPCAHYAILFFVTFLIHLERLDHSIPQYITLHQKCFVRNCEWRGNVSFIGSELRFWFTFCVRVYFTMQAWMHQKCFIQNGNVSLRIPLKSAAGSRVGLRWVGSWVGLLEV